MRRDCATLKGMVRSKHSRFDYEALVVIAICSVLLHLLLSGSSDVFPHGDKHRNDWFADVAELRQREHDESVYPVMNRARRVQRCFAARIRVYQNAIDALQTNTTLGMSTIVELNHYRGRLAVALNLATNTAAADTYAAEHSIERIAWFDLIMMAIGLLLSASIIWYTVRFIRRLCRCTSQVPPKP
ncbi:MAG: hypothetical protein NTV22_08500 [bacterium]|nr:hypothetical protein [bacterium]